MLAIQFNIFISFAISLIFQITSFFKFPASDFQSKLTIGILSTTISGICSAIHYKYNSNQIGHECLYLKNFQSILPIIAGFNLILVIFELALQQTLPPFSTYPIFSDITTLLLVYHLNEFIGLAFFRPEQLEPDAFLLFHSVFYQIAFILIFGEFFLEFHFFPKSKMWLVQKLYWLKFSIAVIGLAIRFCAFWELGSNFDHCIYKGSSVDRLVTSGIYKYERHPSYVGYFLFNLGLNASLGNLFTLLLTGAFFVYFFKRRIFLEEKIMLAKFGKGAYEYKNIVGSIFDLVK